MLVSLRLLGEGTGVLEVLIYLYLYGPVHKSRLSRVVRRSHEGVARSLRILEAMNLVAIHQEGSFPFREVYELSLRGRSLVEAPIHRWPSLFWEWSRNGLIRRAASEDPTA